MRGSLLPQINCQSRKRERERARLVTAGEGEGSSFHQGNSRKGMDDRVWRLKREMKREESGQESDDRANRRAREWGGYDVHLR